MLTFPASTRLNRQLPKKRIYAQFNLKPVAREKFDADISKIMIIHEITPETTRLAKGETVTSFYVLHVSLKHLSFDEKNVVLLSKLINQQMLFVLECGSQAKLAVFHGILHQTEWMPVGAISVQLTGLNLDTAWENIILQVGGIQIEPGNTLDEQIRQDTANAQVQKQIDTLERKARAEKQPKRKFELVQEIKELEREKHNKQ